MHQNKFVGAREFAEAIGAPEESVRRWVNRGVLPAVKLGRLVLIPTDALERILDGRALDCGQHARVEQEPCS